MLMLILILYHTILWILFFSIFYSTYSQAFLKSSQLGRAWQAGAKHLLLVGGNDLPQRLERNELHYREEPQPPLFIREEAE